MKKETRYMAAFLLGNPDSPLTDTALWNACMRKMPKDIKERGDSGIRFHRFQHLRGLSMDALSVIAGDGIMIQEADNDSQ